MSLLLHAEIKVQSYQLKWTCWYLMSCSIHICKPVHMYRFYHECLPSLYARTPIPAQCHDTETFKIIYFAVYNQYTFVFRDYYNPRIWINQNITRTDTNMYWYFIFLLFCDTIIKRVYISACYILLLCTIYANCIVLHCILLYRILSYHIISYQAISHYIIYVGICIDVVIDNMIIGHCCNI